jgi:hypothetical protein
MLEALLKGNGSAQEIAEMALGSEEWGYICFGRESRQNGQSGSGFSRRRLTWR